MAKILWCIVWFQHDIFSRVRKRRSLKEYKLQMNSRMTWIIKNVFYLLKEVDLGSLLLQQSLQLQAGRRDNGNYYQSIERHRNNRGVHIKNQSAKCKTRAGNKVTIPLDMELLLKTSSLQQDFHCMLDSRNAF